MAEQEIKSYDELGPIIYPFVIMETWQCEICKEKFTAEVEYLSPTRTCILSPSDHIDSLLKHRDEHINNGEDWKAWHLTWGKK